MTSRVEQVTQENARLHSELRKSLEARIETITQSGSSTTSSGIGVGGVMDALQQQMEMVTKDRDNYRELLKKTANELDLLQRIDQVSQHANALKGRGGEEWFILITSTGQDTKAIEQ